MLYSVWLKKIDDELPWILYYVIKDCDMVCQVANVLYIAIFRTNKIPAVINRAFNALLYLDSNIRSNLYIYTHAYGSVPFFYERFFAINRKPNYS